MLNSILLQVLQHFYNVSWQISCLGWERRILIFDGITRNFPLETFQSELVSKTGVYGILK